jgi:hypothetical protein
MKRAYSIYPKNKIFISNSLFPMPLKNNSFSYENTIIDNGNRLSAIPKSEKIKKFIEEIKSSNANTNTNSNLLNFPNEQNSLYTCQRLLIEEKIKNKNYNDNIIALNKQIEEMECKMKFGDQNINNEIIKLRQENQELKMFKEKVYSFSLKYDELNRDIINCLKSIEHLVHIFNDDNSNSIQSQSLEYRNNNLNKISNNFKSILNDLSDLMKIKQSEYNTLLMEKEKEIQKLKRDFNNINPDTYSIGLKSCRNCEPNKKKSDFSKLSTINLNNLNDFEKTCPPNGFYKIYKTNEFDFKKNGKNKNKMKFKSSFNL